MGLGDLRQAVGADLAEFGQIGLQLGVRIVTAAERAVPDALTIAPALGSGDVPDVLVGTAQAQRCLWSKLFCHRASLLAGRNAIASR
jgi:hypothetical protein